METDVFICADCRKALQDFPCNAADLLLTDPPYLLGKKMNGGTWGATKGERMGWDRQGPEDIRDCLDLACFASRNQIIWGGNYFSFRPSRCWLSWYKRDAVPTMSDFELAWTSFDAVSALFDYPIAAVNAERVGWHPTQKPVALFEWCISRFTKPGDLVLDPFCGSGTTAIACHRLGRRFICIDDNPEYIEKAKKRFEEYAAQQDLFPVR